jgi:hypothetical protein
MTVVINNHSTNKLERYDPLLDSWTSEDNIIPKIDAIWQYFKGNSRPQPGLPKSQVGLDTVRRITE